MQLKPWNCVLAVKLPAYEADHSSPSSAKVKNEWRYTSTPLIYLYGVSMDGFAFTNVNELHLRYVQKHKYGACDCC